MDQANLSNATDDQLIKEIMSRKNLACSIWSIEDVRSIIAEDEDCQDLTEEQIENAATAFLRSASRDLKDVLGSRGNKFLEDRWAVDSADVLRNVSKPWLSPR